jgi:outer membrane protein TolC
MRYVTMLSLLAGLAGPAAAQAPTDTTRLTLDEAVHRALEQGVDMRLARAAVQTANGQVREAFSPALPQVTTSLTYTRQFASIYSGLEPGTGFDTLFKNTPFGAPNAWNLQFQASQLLWSGGKVGAALGAAKSFRQVASLQQEETAAEVTFQVKQAYWEAALQGRLVTIAVDNLDEARQHLHEVQLYQQAGTRAEYDLLLAQVDAANQEPAVVAARNGYDVARLELKRLLALPADQPLVLTTTLDSPNATIPVVVADSLGGSVRAGLAAADASVHEEEQLLKVARADRWPTLSFTTTYNEQAFPGKFFPVSGDLTQGWNGEVKLSFPIFTGFRTAGKVEQAQAAVLRANAQRDQFYRQVDLQVAQARAEVDRARALLTARHQTVRQGQRAHYLASVRYTNGMATQLDVTAARVAGLRAEVNEVQATRDYFVALAQLERALGRPVPVVQQPIEQVAAALNMKEAQP